MSAIRKRLNVLQMQADILRGPAFRVQDAVLDSLFVRINGMLDDTIESNHDDMEGCLDAIDGRLEDVCIEHDVREEWMDELIEESVQLKVE